MNPTLSLPDDIVDHIQSFLSFKDAARTACVSTRLYAAWYTRNSLMLDETEFHNVNAFWYGARKTIRRYSAGRLHINKITLRLVCGYERYHDCRFLLEDAAKLGVTELAVHLYNDAFNYLIPASVLASDKLLKFTLTGGSLHVGHELPFTCPSVQTLCLLPKRAIGYRGDLLQNIVSHCPSLSDLTCNGFLLWVDLGSLSNRTHMLESLTVINLAYQDNIYLNEILSFFKCLKSLTLRNVIISDRLHICSRTIEVVNITDPYRAVTAVLRVPNLKHFKFDGVPWSSFTFESPHRGWRSSVNIVCFRSSAYWFPALHNLLRRLSSSAIHLLVRVQHATSNTLWSYKGAEEPISVESLHVATSSPNQELIEALFGVCVPSYFHYNHDDY